MWILSQNRCLIENVKDVGIFPESEKVWVILSNGGTRLGVYNEKRAKEIFREICLSIKESNNYYELPEK